MNDKSKPRHLEAVPARSLRREEIDAIETRRGVRNNATRNIFMAVQLSFPELFRVNVNTAATRVAINAMNSAVQEPVEAMKPAPQMPNFFGQSGDLIGQAQEAVAKAFTEKAEEPTDVKEAA